MDLDKFYAFKKNISQKFKLYFSVYVTHTKYFKIFLVLCIAWYCFYYISLHCHLVGIKQY